MPAYPPVDESLDRLRRAGWNVGDVGNQRTVADAARVGNPIDNKNFAE